MSYKRVFDKRAAHGAVVEQNRNGVKFRHQGRRDNQHWFIELIDFVTKLG